VSESLFSGHESPFSGHESLFSGHESLFSGHESPFSGHESLFSGHESLFSGHESLFSGHESLFSGHKSRFSDTRKSVFYSIFKECAGLWRLLKNRPLFFSIPYFLALCLVAKLHDFWVCSITKHYTTFKQFWKTPIKPLDLGDFTQHLQPLLGFLLRVRQNRVTQDHAWFSQGI
jgi:hypothetical protein